MPRNDRFLGILPFQGIFSVNFTYLGLFYKVLAFWIHFNYNHLLQNAIYHNHNPVFVFCRGEVLQKKKR